MTNKMIRLQHFVIRTAVVALVVAAWFNFRCPVQGCPACKLVGK